MYEKLFMSANFWHQDVRVSHLQKIIAFMFASYRRSRLFLDPVAVALYQSIVESAGLDVAFVFYRIRSHCQTKANINDQKRTMLRCLFFLTESISNKVFFE